MQTSDSMHSHYPVLHDSTSCSSRAARRTRAEQRLSATHVRSGRPLRTDRLTPIVELLRQYREARTPQAAWILRHNEVLRAEVESLEASVATLTRSQQRRIEPIRQALDFLKSFGRITSLDFSSIPSEERDALITLLQLEHRWCYAAAGTTREEFKVAIGRTGAR